MHCASCVLEVPNSGRRMTDKSLTALPKLPSGANKFLVAVHCRRLVHRPGEL